MKAKLNVAKLDNGRTILLEQHKTAPQNVDLLMRPSTTSPTRIKAILTVPLDDEKGVPLPFCEAHVGHGWTVEFRLEMN